MMTADDQGYYQALTTRDPRFDGRIFVGVKTTRIYCRPICTVRVPKRVNCVFFASAAAAEVAGFRPCLRCRPELAPGQASVDATRRLADAAATLIENGGLTDGSLAALAEQLGVTDRHLRRVFHQELGVAPVEYAQTQRLLLAKRLLTDTRLSVVDVAMAAGFGSLRRFNALFKERYRLQPTELRRGSQRASEDQDQDLGARSQEETLTLALAYRPPYAWAEILGFLAGRAIPGVEVVDKAADDGEGGEGSYRRTAGIGKVAGWIEVSHAPERRALAVKIAPSLLPVLPAVLGRVRSLFDIACAPADVARCLGPLAAKAPGLRVPGAFDGFEMAVRAVLGQQVTVAGARTLAGRIVGAFGSPVKTPFAGVDRRFPAPARIAAASVGDLAELGIVRSRAAAIRELAARVEAGALRLDPTVDVAATVGALEEIPGIGPWTAQYIAMRALAWPDAFLPTDYGVKKALGGLSPGAALAAAEAWRPWRSYGVMHLWHSL
jgi:AraC family transcriptional regulator of adaptative response / DNA-3-methyladenine glycosylase II